MSKISPAMSSARRNAEALLTQSKKREASFKSEQEREYEAMVSKTAHLRELGRPRPRGDVATPEHRFAQRRRPHCETHGAFFMIAGLV
jgi:hypothetical protein